MHLEFQKIQEKTTDATFCAKTDSRKLHKSRKKELNEN